MNKRIVLYILGWILIVEGAAMQLPALVGLIYSEKNGLYFLVIGLALALIGFLFVFKKPKKMTMYQKEGFISTALSWLVLSFAGSLPYFLSGEIPHYEDAFFETVSGFTTTGASALTQVENLSHCMNFWRCFSVWLGGMGVLVFLLAIIPKVGGQQNMYLMKAESPGPIFGKVTPKIRDYAAILYSVYLGLTVLEFILLICGGMEIFDAINTSLSNAGTGGFGIRNAGIAAYDSYYLQGVIAVFMMLFGLNFSFYLLILARKFKQSLHITEVWVYLGIIALSTVAITINISSQYPSLFDSFHQSFFYVSSIITTTGFSIGDVNQWPEFSKAIILILTFLGACAGSTGGGFKISRVIILFKEVKKELALIVHPHTVRAVKMDGKKLSHETLRSVFVFFVIYVMLFFTTFLIISLDNFDFVTNFTSVAATINNTGPGFSLVGPTGNYSAFSPLSKYVFSFTMIAGRLELFPIILLFFPAAWKKNG
ncbi:MULTISPECIES: TrkH family potassium uptake protein [unclassified Ruminococcus]|uniref:TrkH family potassium uptake protein n=1 Tax=unclassified Ruminococcus TaxID=2608920 RepID=UPI00210A5B9F|nr:MULTISPECIES: TrkH family potassium uptake protein [unclassified Ruminococcus]MCQ4022663.1 TrkH family potassium uptake protein [Ruminococcus sp. zg-924]MCQ4114903.1 TrkH family potassium uptake protein [Ruminococcus sp. zg-921]